MDLFEEQISGIITKVTYRNEENGWSVLKIDRFGERFAPVTVIVHHVQIYPGATCDFWGTWVEHPKFGRQFKARKIIEKKPATTLALEKYLGSGLIKGVGPKIAKRIVKFFGDETLEIFENEIEKLTNIKGISKEKVKQIQKAWVEHREIRDLMIFLGEHNISTLFAVKIFKEYGRAAIHVIKNNPYQLADDIYGVGFLSADHLALKIGLAKDSPLRISSCIKFVLNNARDSGHCYLTKEQIKTGVNEKLAEDYSSLIEEGIEELISEKKIKFRILKRPHPVECYYAPTLFFDELSISKNITRLTQQKIDSEEEKRELWIDEYSKTQYLKLSVEQKKAVLGMTGVGFSILTGGPGCGKTTTLKILVGYLRSHHLKFLLAAPTGRAAQRMSEVVGHEALTIHRLLVWNPHNGGFNRDEDSPLNCRFLIVDECSMLDTSLAAAVLKAVPENAQVVFIGDADQLPSVGAGNVLGDLLKAGVPQFKLTQVFRQAQESKIIEYAHNLNMEKSQKLNLLFVFQTFGSKITIAFLLTLRK